LDAAVLCAARLPGCFTSSLKLISYHMRCSLFRVRVDEPRHFPFGALQTSPHFLE